MVSKRTADENAPTAGTNADPALPGKGRPTPTRKEREAARKRPLVPNDRKDAAARSRSQVRTERERARAGMAAGDERYLTARDKGPQRRFVRDYVDARFTVGEFLMPLMLVVIVLTFIPVADIQLYGTLLLWLFFALAVVDGVFLGIFLRRRLIKKFGEARLERGLRWYAVMRSIQLRMIRLPKPQVRRGQYPA